MFFGVSYLAANAANSATAQSSKIIPECLLKNNIADMTAAGCDNVNIFIWLAINVGTYIFGFIGALALLFFVYGGFLLILSQGNQEKIKKGTSAITAAVIGLVIAFGAYALITFLGNTIGLKAEKSINFAQSVWAAEGGACRNESGCYCLNESTSECSLLYKDDVCDGTLSDDPCEYQTVDTELGNQILNEGIGTTTEDEAAGVSALKNATRKLNFANIGSPVDLFARAINAMMAFMGSIALILYIYAGFIWMSAGGASEKISKAKNILVWTTLGAIAMGAGYMIIRTVLEKVG